MVYPFGPNSVGFVHGKEYTVKPGDTAWGIVSKAFPNSDPREKVQQIDESLPKDAAHAGDTLQPSDQIVLPDSAKIGQDVLISSEVRGQVPGVIPTYEGSVEPKDYGQLAQSEYHGQTLVVPNSPPPPPAG